MKVKSSFKNVLENMSKITASQTSDNRPSPREAWIAVSNENGISKPNLIGCVSDKEAKGSLLTNLNGEILLVDDLGLIDINEETNSRNSSTDNTSIQMFTATLNGLPGEAKNLLVVAIRNMIDKNRKEMEALDEVNRKDTKNMIEDVRKEIERLDENIQSLFKKV